jgi:hypothetical protein
VATISSFFFLAFDFAFALGAASSFARFTPVFCSSIGAMAAGAEAAVSMLSAGVAKNLPLSEGGCFPLIFMRGWP